MKKISADLIITNQGPPLKNGIIIFDEESSRIEAVLPADSSLRDVQHYRGIVIPGYVNAHCHLELSHLKGVISSGTGLIPFIQGVVGLRDFPEEEILQKINDGDQEMWDNGIVAVGDISNKADTALVKESSPIRYYTFVEMFDFLQEKQAQSIYEQYVEVYKRQPGTGNNRKSFVPHAPYSVSPALFQLVNQVNQAGQSISIHNQELAAENEFFETKTGGFIDFYDSFKISVDHFSATGQHSINYTLQHLHPKFRTLMVHNTMSTKDDIARAMMWNPQTFWVTCPNANLYIENRLPNYQDFIECDATICIGTDSLSSNWQLSIFEELKTIKKYQSGLDDLELVKWATLNGAKALGYNDLGILKGGVAPGINWIDVPVNNGKFDLSEARSSTKLA